MPLRPKKCWGKKVKLTPRNIKKKWTFPHRECRVSPLISGNQCVKAANRAKTAPIDKT